MCCRRSHPAAFTLVEAVLTLVISAILLAAAQSLVLLASKSVPNGRTSGYAAVTAGVALDVFQADLRSATMITVASSTAVEMRVPDRDSDGLQETVRYSWAGSSGSPLLRTVSLSGGSSSSETLVANAAAVAFTHDLIPASAFRSGTTPETLLGSFDPTVTLSSSAVSGSAQSNQTLTLVLPVTATSYNISRVALRMNVSGSSDGVTYVALSAPLLGVVSLSPMGTTTVTESALASTSNWYDFPITTSSAIAAASTTAITLKVSSGSPSAAVDVMSSGAPAAAGGMTRSTNGLSWSSTSDVMPYRVYGTFSTTTNGAASGSPRYGGCSVQIQTVGSVGAAMQIAGRCPNLPEAP